MTPYDERLLRELHISPPDSDFWQHPGVIATAKSGRGKWTVTGHRGGVPPSEPAIDGYIAANERLQERLDYESRRGERICTAVLLLSAYAVLATAAIAALIRIV